MFNKPIIRALLASTILSSVFSAVMITMTAYHHFRMKEMIKEYSRQ